MKLWPVEQPFIIRRSATEADIDQFGHVNNVRYIDWAMDVAWAHSNALGVRFEDYERVGVGCVVWRQEFDYVSPVLVGDAIDIATWISDCDGRLKLTRRYEMRRADNGGPVFRGATHFVSVDMKTGKPARMPALLADAYRPAKGFNSAAQAARG